MPSNLLGFCLASMAIIIVPGPSVLFTLARGVAWGRAVAVLTVAGNALGMLLLAVLVALGLGPILARSAALTTAVELAGGCYLIWLGIDALRHRHAHAAAMLTREAERPQVWTVLRQGFLVGFLNPKALVFYLAVFPHFVNRAAGDESLQLLLLGFVFCLLAFCSDGTWGLIAGTARAWLAGDPARVVILRSIGGVVMVGLGALIIASALGL